MKKIIPLLLFLMASLTPFSSFAACDNNPDTDPEGYCLLASFPGSPTGGEVTSLASYFQAIFWLILGSAVVLSVLMIVIGGIEYMTAGVPSSKQKGKERITGAIIGLLLALSAVLILRTINPALLITGFNLRSMEVKK